MTRAFFFICGALAVFLTFLLLLHGLTPQNSAYLLFRRLPILAAVLIGAGAIGFSTVVFQTVTGNAIITPGLMGIEGLYILVQVALLILFPGLWQLGSLPGFLIGALVLGLYSFALVQQLRGSEGQITRLVLTGIVASTLFFSISAFLQKIIDPNEFVFVQAAMFGSLLNLDRALLLPSGLVMFAGIGLLWIKSPVLDVLTLGRQTAISLGVHYNPSTRMLILVSLLLSSASTALLGPFPFLGLIIASIARTWIPAHKHRMLMPATALVGVVVLLSSHLLLERLLNNAFPVPIFIGFVGGILFLALFVRETRVTAY